MNVIKEIQRMNQQELDGNVSFEASWHQKYKSSAWIYIGGLYETLSEGDILCVFSQVGEIEDIHLIRDVETGKSKGFAFLKYHDQKSTVLAIDNFNGCSLLDRLLRVDHVDKYRLPKHLSRDDSDNEDDQDNIQRGLPGHAYVDVELENEFDLHSGIDVFKKVKDKKKKDKKRKKSVKKKNDDDDVLPLPEKDIILDDNTALEESTAAWRGRCAPNAKLERNEQEWEPRTDRTKLGYGGMHRKR